MYIEGAPAPSKMPGTSQGMTTWPGTAQSDTVFFYHKVSWSLGEYQGGVRSFGSTDASSLTSLGAPGFSL